MTAIEGAAVLVTGGQRGLGEAFAAEFLNFGAAKVYATARVPAPAGDARIEPVALDVTDEAAVAALARCARDVSIVVNNAGLPARGSIMAEPVANVQAVFDTNVFGPLRVARHFAPVLAANGGGAMVNIHSALSWAAGAGAYGASKAALWSVTNALRVELARHGTQVLGVHLGYTDTDMTSSLAVVKNDPRQVARDVLVALSEGRTEVLADDVSRRFKAALSGPVEGLSWAVVDGEVVVGDFRANRRDT
ncbi:SDR family oxidoreductase [Planotetraspora phitsanulokensis]|uniref:Short-chain dehydrogenase n=1 Tax=Planotetraspora phitsanulokensis TaxID=575192 RepID=A0A8J3XHK9_9ACTN|nr:SDR family oxidoreductase [Planotetraspora phitsanulokensis]GII41240.1 short-chain dehydrogenase [Planotetraspora phitsanulokensis]